MFVLVERHLQQCKNSVDSAFMTVQQIVQVRSFFRSSTSKCEISHKNQ